LAFAQTATALGGIVTARALGPEGKGVVTGVLAWPQIFAWVLLFGLGTATSLRVAESHGEALPDALGNALLYCLTLGLVGTVAGLAFLPDALDHLGPSASHTAQWALLGICVSMLSEVVAAIDLALGRTVRYNVARVAGSLSMLMICIALVINDVASPESVVGATIVGGIVGAAIAASGLPWRKVRIALGRLRKDLAYGLRVFLTSLLGLVNLRLDILLMTAFLAASQIGFYTIACNAMFPIAAVTATLASLIMPAVGRARGTAQADSLPHVSLIRRTALRYTIVTATIAAVIAAVAPWGIPFVFGQAFDPAVSLVWILLPGYVAQGYAYMVDAGMVGMRKPWVGNAAQGSGLVITAGLLPFLLPHYGATGAAITSTLSYSVSAVISVWALGRITRGVPSSEIVDIGDAVATDGVVVHTTLPSTEPVAIGEMLPPPVGRTEAEEARAPEPLT
jgi:O-antigen/teichoic acid export membrane protein